MPTEHQAAIWTLSAATVAAIIARPRRIPEWCLALAGAAILIGAGLVPLPAAGTALRDGLDVYLFLAGMLMLAELARVEGVFEWLAAMAVPAARGSTQRLFAGVYILGIAVTALLSNDATVVLLTPAVLAAVRRAGAPLMPFAFLCAFVANAASFVLPISNPANLVVFRELPALASWLAAFALPSLAAITATYIMLHLMHGRELRTPHNPAESPVHLSRRGRFAAVAVLVSAALVVVCAGLGLPVGPTEFVLGVVSLGLIAILDRPAAINVLRETPWSIIPLTAALFVIVAALDRTGAVNGARWLLSAIAHRPEAIANLFAGSAIATAANLFNNLPVGVLARYALQVPDLPPNISHAVLVGVDLGPNVSITGSLATLLWMMLLKREGIEVTPWQFLRLGLVVTIPALVLALLAVR